ncbi:phage head-tail connector protein [Paraliobacillus sediminis]|uniref:phage head-tail connector protein n=1 Tax=Paraliobacillus sediminis TaxID=1885916 RepID=UPI000E3CF18F|nr:phage head-tail connector protein [Paraliobacillus sediminis]
MVTKDEFKTAIGITSDTKDAQITLLIELAEESIKEYCNITELPTAYKRNVIKMVEYDMNRKTGITSESLSRHSVSFATDYPADILRGLKRRIRWP